MAIKRVTFRLYPNKAQNKKMHYWQRLHKDLYNGCVMHRKEQYERFGENVTYFQKRHPSEVKRVCVEPKISHG